MANRFPLIFNSGAGQIQELAASDNLDLTSSNLVNAGILFTSSGSDTAPSLQIGSGTTYKPGLYSPGTDQLAISTNGVERLSIGSTATEVVFNDTGVNYDFRIEGDTVDSLFFVDASTDRVGIRTTTPAGELDVRGLNSGNLYVGRTNNSGSGSEPGSINLSGPNASGTARVWGRINSIIDTATEGSEASNLAFRIQKAGNLIEAARLDSSGRLLVGTSTARSNINHRGSTGVAPNVQFETATASYSGGLSIINNSTTGNAATLTLGTSKGGGIGSNTIVGDNEQTGTISFSASDGTNFIDCAQVRAEVDGTPGANDMPGRLVFSTNPGSPATPPTERMRIKANGDVSIVTGNLIIGTAGKGIDFSADGNAAGMTSELLDDYEEGTWTPAVTFGGGTTGITYDGFTSGRYTKVGRLVTLHGTLKLTNKGASTGNALIIGFPFTPANANANYASSSVGGTAAITYTGTLIGAPEGINVHIALFSYTEAGTRTQLNETNFANNSELTFTITYTV